MGVSNNKQSVAYRYDKDIKIIDDVYDRYESTAVEARRELFKLLAKYIIRARSVARTRITADTNLFLAEFTAVDPGGVEGIPPFAPGTRDAIDKVEGEGKQLTDEQKKGCLICSRVNTIRLHPRK